MKMFAATLLTLCTASGSTAFAADFLQGDAVVCETEENLAFLQQPHVAGHPGSTVMEKANAAVRLFALMGEYHRVMGDLAVKEERIRASANMRGSSQARASASSAAALDDRAKAEEAAAFVRQCIAVPGQHAVTVVERRPISGVLKINMPINGMSADVWTMEYYLDGAPARAEIPRAAIKFEVGTVEESCARIRQVSNDPKAEAQCYEQEPAAREWARNRQAKVEIAEKCNREGQLSGLYFMARVCVEREEAAKAPAAAAKR